MAPGHAADASARQLLIVARADGPAVDLEFTVCSDAVNIEDQLSVLGHQEAQTPDEDEFSLRLLRHQASAVRHQQFHDTDVLLLRVGPEAAED